MNLILWISVIWIIPLFYFMLRNETKFKKNIVLGVTFPYTARDDADVQELLAKFRRILGYVCIGLFVIAVPCMLIRDVMTAMTVWLIWIDLMIIVPYIPYFRYHAKLKALKREKGWARHAGEPVLVRTETIPAGKWTNPLALWPAVLICFVPILWMPSFWVMYVTMAVTCAFCWFGYRYMYRNKAETVDDNITVTKALTQIRRHNWSKTWILCAYFLALNCVIIGLASKYPALSFALTIVLALILVVIVVRIEFRIRGLQEKLTKESGTGWYVDEDDRWIGGMFYYNPDDARLVVNNRIGLNSTVNVAKPAGKVIMGFVALLLLVLPFTGPIMSKIGSNAVTVEAKAGETILFSTDPEEGAEGQGKTLQEIADAIAGGTLPEDAVITVRHGSAAYTVAAADIAEAEVLEKLPNGLVKVIGTNLPNYYKGDFSAKEYGALKVCLDPNQGPFLLLKTKDGTAYLFGARA